MALGVLNREELLQSSRARGHCERIFRRMGEALFPRSAVAVQIREHTSDLSRRPSPRPTFALAHPEGGPHLIWRSSTSSTGCLGLHAQLAQQLGQTEEFHGCCLVDSESLSVSGEPVRICFETDRVVLFQIDCWIGLPADQHRIGYRVTSPQKRGAFYAQLDGRHISIGSVHSIKQFILQYGTEVNGVSFSPDHQRISFVEFQEVGMENAQAGFTLDLGELDMKLENVLALRRGEMLEIERPDGVLATIRLAGAPVAAGVLEAREDGRFAIKVTDIFSGRRNLSVERPNHL